MRPGLHKPGALPLLVVIVFSLLTLVPSLPSIPSLKLADLSYLLSRGRRKYIPLGNSVYRDPRKLKRKLINLDVPLIQDNVADLSCPDTHLSDAYTPWIPTIPSRPRVNRLPRSARLATGAPMISSETAPVENRSRSAIATEPSFLFSRRAHAFRTYFIQQLDDYQFLSPFSTRMSTGTGAVAADRNPSIPPTYPPSLPTAIDACTVDSTFHPSNESTYLQTPPSVPKQQLLLGGMWQQVCQTASGLWDLANESPNSPLPRLLELGSYYAQSTLFSHSPIVECQKPLITHPNISQAESQECPATSAHTNKSQIQSNDQATATDAAGRHSSKLDGSCMAVVIGLVAGIVWF
ncbi:hypothetical protein N7478_005112 [Penicillium angulare]|uniref:uncharacterized protein n=1 Tax=Penicillium angulare TaxID=116970 RepID=UPI00254127FA|nr:uncharacterized protein N7478_005112 [Penicillium angulare]KAJ5279740.1 hypothetical protein N7478_005112 [Penicillium angulare]